MTNRPYPPTSHTGRPRVIVCGSRTFCDKELLEKWMDRLTANMTHPIIVVGCEDPETRRRAQALGADELAEEWALSRRMTVREFHAEWETHGRAAGPIRNSEMVEFAAGNQPEQTGWCAAFHDGASPGTLDTITKAKRAGLRVRVINY